MLYPPIPHLGGYGGVGAEEVALCGGDLVCERRLADLGILFKDGMTPELLLQLLLSQLYL